MSRIVRIIISGFFMLTFSCLVGELYKLYFYNHILPELKLVEGVIGKKQYKGDIPEMMPDNFLIVRVNKQEDYVQLKYMFDNGMVWTCEQKDDERGRCSSIRLERSKHWTYNIPVFLSFSILFAVVIMHVSRTGRILILAPRLDLHSPLENELLFYSILLILGRFMCAAAGINGITQ